MTPENANRDSEAPPENGTGGCDTARIQKTRDKSNDARTMPVHWQSVSKENSTITGVIGITVPGLLLRSRTPEPPYCWQSKEAIRKIREYMQERDQWSKIPSRLGVYFALCEMASNKQAESFCVSQKALTDLCGYSARTQSEVLSDLEGAGTIQTFDPPDGMQGKKTYLLLSARSEATSERSEVDGNKPSLPTLEEQEKKHEKEQRKNDSSDSSSNRPSRPPSARIQLVDEQHVQELKTIYRPRDVDKAIADCKAWLCTPKGQGKQLTKRRLQTFLRDAEPFSAEQTTKPTSSGRSGTWIDANKAKEPQEQPCTIEQQKEYARQLAEMRRQAFLRSQEAKDAASPS